jgi:hypothetical protein
VGGHTDLSNSFNVTARPGAAQFPTTLNRSRSGHGPGYGPGMSALARAALASLCAACVARPPEPAEVRENLLASPPSPQVAVNADLDGKVVYLGLDAEPAVEVGREIRLTHYWKVVAPPGEGWQLFVHAEEDGDGTRLNLDHVPMAGAYPVPRWKAGDIIRDRQSFRLPARWRTSGVRLLVGLWRDSERMPVRQGPVDGEGRVIAARLTIKPPPGQLSVQRYFARRTRAPVTSDGKLDEAAWKAAPPAGPLVDALTGRPASPPTEVRMLWDERALYLGVRCEDPDVGAAAAPWNGDAVEVLIADRGSRGPQLRWQVGPGGVIKDLSEPAAARPPIVAAQVQGTIDDHRDRDRGWTVEMAIPLAALAAVAQPPGAHPPRWGDIWSLNLIRREAGAGHPAIEQVWSRLLDHDVHALDQSGDLIFADEKGEHPSAAVEREEQAEEAKERERDKHQRRRR